MLEETFFAEFIPHGHCYLWQTNLVGLHVTSDALIGVSYYSIPWALFYFVQNRRDVPFKWIFFLFASFIVSCGTTHFLEVWTLWHPDYWVSGAMKAITALVSLHTALSLIPILPQALDLPSPAQLDAINQKLQMEIIEHQKTEVYLQESEKRYIALLAAVPVGILRTDCAGNCTYANSSYCQITGLAATETTGKAWQDRLYQEDRDRVITNWNHSLTENHPFAHEFRFQHVDGTITWVYGQSVAERDIDGEIIGYVSTVTNITDQKQIEMKLLQTTAQLQTSNQELESFAYSVSHDLRAPLRAIDGYTKILLEDNLPVLTVEAQEYCYRIRKNVSRMATLIDDLLRLSRVSRAEIRYSTVNLSTLAQEILHDLQTTEPERQVEIVIAPEAIVDADATLMRVALENLLQNAWKFTSHRQVAQIRFGILSQQQPIYFIQDNGAGFDMSYIDKLFGVFQRLHNVEEFPGTGIGLATVQKIIQRHGGAIWAEGAIEKGATIYFTLPYMYPELGE